MKKYIPEPIKQIAPKPQNPIEFKYRIIKLKNNMERKIADIKDVEYDLL